MPARSLLHCTPGDPCCLPFYLSACGMLLTIIHYHQMAEWLVENLPAGGVVGVDPSVHAVSDIQELEKALKVRPSVRPSAF